MIESIQKEAGLTENEKKFEDLLKGEEKEDLDGRDIYGLYLEVFEQKDRDKDPNEAEIKLMICKAEIENLLLSSVKKISQKFNLSPDVSKKKFYDLTENKPFKIEEGSIHENPEADA